MRSNSDCLNLRSSRITTFHWIVFTFCVSLLEVEEVLLGGIRQKVVQQVHLGGSRQRFSSLLVSRHPKIQGERHTQHLRAAKTTKAATPTKSKSLKVLTNLPYFNQED